MATSTSILILGKSGSGKSHAIKHLDPKTTILINTVGKDIPYLGSRADYREGIKKGGNMYVPSFNTITEVRKSTANIIKLLDYVDKERKEIKTVVLDDLQYVMSLTYFKGDYEGFDKFDKIGSNMVSIFEKARQMRGNLTVFFLSHSEEVDGLTTMKTIGKLFREKYTPEGVFSIVLGTAPEIDIDTEKIIQYRFKTQSSGSDTLKSPEEMFPPYIENNLEKIRKRVYEYFSKGIPLEKSEVYAPDDGEFSEEVEE